MTGASTQGLTSYEAGERLRRDGPNVLPSARPRTLVAIAAGVLREPMLLLLVSTGLLYMVLGEPTEAAAMIVAVLVVLGTTFIQERRTERTLHALRDLSSPRALVLRDGQAVRIPGADVVRGDVVIVGEGDRIAADAQIVESTGLELDESMLTGESMSVFKRPGDRVYSGTLVVAGRGLGTVEATGRHTELGRIGHSLATVETGSTPLQAEVRRVVLLLATAGLSACLAVVVLYGAGRGEWLQGLLAGLTMAIAMVPEEFPVILTIFLALGAWRISQQRVLTRRFPAIEALGAATVLCVDKTGTLTVNRMTVAGVDADGRFEPLDESSIPPESVAQVIAWGARASNQRPVDPIDTALVRAAAGRSPGDGWQLAREYPLTNALLAAANGWTVDGSARVIAAKGAPEAIAMLCELAPAALAALHVRVERMAQGGLRVLAVARAEVDGDFPAALEPGRFSFLGLVGFTDPVRPTVPAAIRDCRSAGIRVMMLTGDYPATALAIARAIELDTSDGVLTGTDIARMDDDALARAARSVHVFARVVPAQKLRLVRALQESGAVVAMTGDGVNDAPALKAANIGVAMGLRGTDVAREAGALVLLDDDFASIVGAVRLGRRIYENIRKASGYVLAIHLPIAGMSLLPPLLGGPLVLLPLHVVFMELIVDPACSIAFEMEPEEGHLMARPPRSPGTRLFDAVLVWRSLLEGVGMLLVALAVYVGSSWMALPDGDIRTLTFSTLIASNLALLVANRSGGGLADTWRSANPAAWAIVGGATVALATVLAVPALRDLFRLSTPHLDDLAVCAAAALACVAWVQGVKRLPWRRWTPAAGIS